jgi:2,3-bisphosphoglycerate-independent phosphoglycerate mutase
MLFLDGVGIGKNDPGVNPLLSAHLPALRSLLNDALPTLRNRRIEGHHAVVLPVDATMGVPGLPQSGTGQTALFAGVNGPKLAGKHFGPYPYSTLRPIIAEKNIFRTLKNAGKRPYFANTFPQRFFDYFDHHRSRLTVTTFSCLASEVPLLRERDLREGRGLSADITGAGWKDLGYPDMPVIDPEVAGERLAALASEFDFVLFEYWKTDHAGHSQSRAEAAQVLETFDAMLAGVLRHLDWSSTLVMITSDHGNIEDLTTKGHTRNPVPAFLIGHRHRELAAALQGTSRKLPTLATIPHVLIEAITHHI